MADSIKQNILENLLSIYPLIHMAVVKLIICNDRLTIGGYYTLSRLDRTGKLKMSDIGKRLSIPRPNITALVDKLISDELAERSYDSNDRRCSH